MKKNIRLDAVVLAIVTMLLVSSLAITMPNVAKAQADTMTFTSDIKLSFGSTNEMIFKSPNKFLFTSGIKMGFGTGIIANFTVGVPGWIQQCTYGALIQGTLPTPCTWWELLNETTLQPTGYEFHVDTNPAPNTFHIDQVIPGQIQVNPAKPVIAELKIDSLEPCDYFKVHWPEGYTPTQCTWWEVISPTILEGYEFHVDGGSSGEFHVDAVLPQSIVLPAPGVYEIVAEQKIPDVTPCDEFVVEDPPGWYPEPCTWWEIIDPYTWEPTGFEFHVDWTNESCEFHVDEVLPHYYVPPYEPGVPYLIAEQKTLNITACDWFEIVRPSLPEVCSWWEVLDPNGLPIGEFHVDEVVGTEFHVDQVIPDPLDIPWGPFGPAYYVTARQKVDLIAPCEWYNVTSPSIPTAFKPCTWWKIISPSIGDVEFHVDEVYQNGSFHIDEVYPSFSVPISPPAFELIAELKIGAVNPCDDFKVIDPQGYLPRPCTWWRITSPPEWAGVTFHVDSNDGIDHFHTDYVDALPQGPIPPPWNVTAEEFEPPSPWYWKPEHKDYAQSGMPDFDQRQWGTYIWQDMWQVWSHCGPVSVANSLWWLDSEFEPNPKTPPIINDGFLLVQAYGQWDDHDPMNVPWLVEHLAFLMDTDGRRTGLIHSGTNVTDMQAGLAHYLSWTGVNPLGDVDGDGMVTPNDEMLVILAMGTSPGMPGWNLAADIFPVTLSYPPVTDNVTDQSDLMLVQMNMGLTGLFYEHTVDRPTFEFIEEEVERCEDVVLLLGYWYYNDMTGEWYRESGHYVTVAGVDSLEYKIAISDPYEDAFERGLIPEGRVPVPHGHPPLEPPYTTHNNASLVSHDIYNVAPILTPLPCPGGDYTLIDYVNWQPTPPFFTVIESAVVTSPLGVRDLAVINVTTSKTGCKTNATVGLKFKMRINVTLENQGQYAETFNVKVYADAFLINQTSVIIPATIRRVITFVQNTSGLAYANYTISATVDPVPSEVDLADNQYSDWVIVTIPGDLNGNYHVTSYDLALLIAAYGSDPYPPNPRPWNPNADINDDEKVTSYDLGVLLSHYGE